MKKKLQNEMRMLLKDEPLLNLKASTTRVMKTIELSNINTTDLDSYLLNFFPDPKLTNDEISQWWAEAALEVMKNSIIAVCKDGKKHSLLECYEYAEKNREELYTENMHIGILSTIRSSFLQ